MKQIGRMFLVMSLVVFLASPWFVGQGVAAQADLKPIKIVGLTMLPEGHVFHRTLLKFADLLKEYYRAPLEVEVHHSGDLGTEKDAIEFMIQGVAVDFAIISPAWIATWDKTAPIIDAPFLFKDVDHWGKCLDAKVFQPIEDTMIKKGVRFIGYGGGSTRNIISRKPIYKMEDFPSLRMRVQGSPLHQKVFSAVGLQAVPMDYMEVYNAIKTGVIDALENEPPGLESMKFYEVAPYYILTRHQIVTRINAMSEKKFKSYPKELQEAILKAGKEAAAWHRETEIAESQQILDRLQKNFGLKLIPFDNTEMRERAIPIVAEYAKEIGAYDIFERVNAID